MQRDRDQNIACKIKKHIQSPETTNLATNREVFTFKTEHVCLHTRIIDFGSQRLFVRDRFRRYKLKVLGYINMNVNRFGSVETCKQRIRLREVKVRSQLHQGEYTFEAVAVSHIWNGMTEIPFISWNNDLKSGNSMRTLVCLWKIMKLRASANCSELINSAKCSIVKSPQVKIRHY